MQEYLNRTTVDKTNYGEYASSNYGSHTQQVYIGTLTLWFSYDTCVAFQDQGKPRIVSENVWGVTTGKHLNWIEPNKKKRTNHDKFKKLLEEVLERHRLNFG